MTLSTIIDKFIDLGLQIIPFLAAVAFLTFLLGVGRFIRSADNETELKKSKSIIIWGIIGLFVLMSIWGIVAFLQSEFGFGNNVGLPQIKFP